MKNKPIQLIVALAIAAVAMLGTQQYISSERERLSPGNRVRVAVAKSEITAGTRLHPGMIKFVDVPGDFVPLVALRENSIEDYNGLEFMVGVQRNDYILQSYFTIRRAVGTKLSDQVVGEYQRAVTLPVDQTNSLAGSIVTGDRIDISLTFNLPDVGGKMSTVLLQNVQVIATGSYSVAEQELGQRGGRGARYNSLTLLLTADDAMRLNFARQVGQIDILLRNSTDSSMIEVRPISGIADLLSAAEKELVANMVKQSQLSVEEQEKIRDQLKELFQSQARQQQLRDR